MIAPSPLSCALWALSQALAGPADDLLARVDEASNRGGDGHLVLDVATTDARGDPDLRTLEIWQKGDEKRLVRFSAPPRLAGIALLVPDSETLYLFLPAYGRPRRVVGDARGDSFMGTDFAMEDLARLSWSADYVPELVEADHLRLTPKPGSDVGKGVVDLWVRPEDQLPARVEHRAESGEIVRRIEFGDVRDAGGRPLAHAVVVEDVVRTRTTKATVREASFGASLEDDLFSVSTLGQ